MLISPCLVCWFPIGGSGWIICVGLGWFGKSSTASERRPLGKGKPELRLGRRNFFFSWSTIVHEFLLFYSHTEWNLVYSRAGSVPYQFFLNDNNGLLTRTVWNRHASDVLRGSVRRLEAGHSSGGGSPPPSSQLTRLHNSHSVSGGDTWQHSLARECYVMLIITLFVTSSFICHVIENISNYFIDYNTYIFVYSKLLRSSFLCTSINASSFSKEYSWCRSRCLVLRCNFWCSSRCSAIWYNSWCSSSCIFWGCNSWCSSCYLFWWCISRCLV